MESRPSSARQVAAGVVMAAGAAGVIVAKWTRTEGLASTAWLVGVLPNFVSAAVAPLVVFLARRSLRGRDFLGMTAFSCLGLCIYEFAQLGMPRRTFDWGDIGATFAGALLALVLGAVFFLTSGKNTA